MTPQLRKEILRLAKRKSKEIDDTIAELKRLHRRQDLDEPKTAIAELRHAKSQLRKTIESLKTTTLL